MKLRFFTVVAMSPEADQDSLNAFLANHRVVTVDKELVQQGVESFWTVCVSSVGRVTPAIARAMPLAGVTRPTKNFAIDLRQNSGVD